MLRGVDAKAVDAIFVDPGTVDLDHPTDDARMLGEHVVEADEIAHGAGFTAERAVAAVVIVEGIVEPGWTLDVLLCWRNFDGVGVVRIRQPGEVRWAPVALKP